VELDHLEAFVAIVARGGVTRAALALHLSQPAISRRLHLLEHELGVPLFERIGRTLTLTDGGRAFLPHAQAVLAALRDGVAAVHGVADGTQGTVTLALVGTLASSALTQCLQRFRCEHPAIDLRLRTALSAEVSALVHSGDASLGLRYRADPGRGLISRRVYDERLVLVCSAQSPLGRSPRVSVNALAGERWLAFPPQPGRRQEPYTNALEERLAANGLHGAVVVPIDSLSAQKRLVEAGFGVALLPDSSVVEELRAKTLRVLHIRSMQTSIPVTLVQRRSAYLSGATRALAAALMAWPHTRGVSAG
jgi:DNA-binding transcriptional LysR family regulator